MENKLCVIKKMRVALIKNLITKLAIMHFSLNSNLDYKHNI